MNQSVKQKILYLKKPFEILQQAQVAKILFHFLYSLRKKLNIIGVESQIEFDARGYYRKYNIVSSLPGYNNFNSYISVSRNEILAHGTPSEYALQKNDIVTVDLVANNFGWHADISWSYIVGDADDRDTIYLREAAWKVSRAGALVAKPGNTINDIAHEVLEEASRLGVHVYHEFAGHGIGREMHELPNIYYMSTKDNIILEPGMVICIEPIVSLIQQKHITKQDGSIVGVDNHKSASFEHMIAIFNSESRLLSSDLLHLESLSLRPFF